MLGAGATIRIVIRRGVYAMKATKPFVLVMLIFALLAATLVLGTIGCGSKAETSTTATQASSPTTVSTAGQTTTGPQPTEMTSSSIAAVSSTTTEPSRPMTTEPNPGESYLDDSHVGGYGYVHHLMGWGDYRVAHIVYVNILTGDEAEVAAIEDGELQPGEELAGGYYIRKAFVLPEGEELTGRDEHPANEIRPTTSITTYTFGEGGEQTMTLEEFIGLFDTFGEPLDDHVRDTIWWVERDEASIVSMTEHVLP
jgi:hypothetical protein